jgi:hypothetical protein
MSDMQTAPAATAAPAAPEPVTVSNLADMFKAELDAESVQPEPATPVEAGPELAVEAEAAQPEISDESSEVTADADPATQEPAPPAVSVPGMSEADKAVFAKLPPDMQKWVSTREAQRQADYTRKTQEAAEQRKTLDYGVNAVKARLEQYDAILSRFTEADIAPPDPALRNSDPVGFEDAMASYLQAKHNQEIAAKEQARIRAEHERVTSAQVEIYQREQAQKLLELAPELAAADDKGKAARKAVYDYGLKAGYTKDQLAQASAADMVTLSKAQKYDAMQAAAKAAKPVPQAAPKVAQPGPAKAIGRPSNLAVAIQETARTGSRESLAAAYLAQINSERR